MQVRHYSVHLFDTLEQKIIPAARDEEGVNPVVHFLRIVQDVRRVLLDEPPTTAPTEGAKVAKIWTIQTNFQCVCYLYP